jgi:TonB family protein
VTGAVARGAAAVLVIAGALAGCAGAREPRGGSPAAVTPSSPGGAPPAIALDAPIAHPDPEARRYLEGLRTSIRRGWAYPCVPGAGPSGCVYPEGTVVLDVRIAWDGTLVLAQVARPSGHRELDAAATDAVTRAAPFGPVPTALKRPGPELPVRATMTYRRPR